MKKQFANILTGSRILCSLWLFSLPVFSADFYALYLLCGLSDIADGIVARRTGTDTVFGSKLDSVADLLFTVSAFIKILPVISLPDWILLWIILILILKITNVISSFLKYKQIIFLHTTMNRITGLLLFLLPLTIPFMNAACSSAVICAVASSSSIQEGYYIRTKNDIH